MARLDELERKFEESPHRYFASLANEYRKAGEPQRAADMCRTQLAAIPGHISGHIVLGQALYDSGDFEESRTALERALTLDPENIVALRYLGDIARDTGDVPGAERWYTRTLEADPYNEAATAALQAIREPAPGDSSEIVSTSSADASPIEPTAGFEHTAPLAGDPETDWSVPDVEDVPESAVVEHGHTVDAYETAQPTDYQEPVTDSTDEPPLEPSIEPVVEATSDFAQATAAAPTEGPVPEAEVEAAPEPEPVLAIEATDEPEPVAAAEAQAPAELEQELPDAVAESADFAGDLEISAAGEAAEPIDPAATDAAAQDAAVIEFIPEKSPDLIIAEESPVEPPEEYPVEPVDVAAHPLPEPVTVEELIQAEEFVMESAAPFVTETMADLYLEQGYPHEALELLLQLSEQRPEDAQLRDKIESIKSVIAARRDAAVAAARAERAEVVETADAAETATTAAAVEALETPEHMTASEETTLSEPLEPEPLPAPEPPAPPPQPRSVRELFARMDNARPRGSTAGIPRAPSRLRSDFVPLPDTRDSELAPADDPFGFPDAQPAVSPAPPAAQPSILPRTSGPHPTFDPSTAELADFDAWLRGLRGP